MMRQGPFMSASSLLEVLDKSRQFSGAADESACGLRQFNVLATACGCYVALAIILFGDSYTTIIRITSGRLMLCVLAVAVMTACIARLRSGSDAPLLSWTRAYFSEVGPQALCLNLGFLLTVAAFSTLKTNISHIVPFYADIPLARIDLWLHGQQPWKCLHAMPRWVGAIIDFVYSQVWFMVLIGGFIASTLICRGARLRRFVWAVFLVYALLGSFMAAAFASVGPIYYDQFYPDPLFGELTATLRADGGLVFVKQYADYLLLAQKAGQSGLGTGISAMPSVHVAFAVLIAWWSTGWGRGWAILGWFYAVFIMIGSVYTGWHYAVDGYVSAILTSAIWLGLSRYYGLAIAWRGVPADSSG